MTANYSKSQAESLARSYAKEIVDRSVTKIQEKVRKLQVSKIISEIEEGTSTRSTTRRRAPCIAPGSTTG